ncbi:MAG: hypothetical protein UHP27_05110 [Muribaculaceae bacterium]|nr:hypothetical protein [Muribaculaceae bacterium]
MIDRYIRKYWEEENVEYFLHFRDEEAIRQIEVHPDKIVMLSTEHPVDDESFLYDQNYSDIEWNVKDFISAEEFDKTWNHYSGHTVI